MVEVSIQQLRLHFTDAVSGKVIKQTTYQSKKKARVAAAAAAAAAESSLTSLYPLIERITAPTELMLSWYERYKRRVLNTWIPVISVFLFFLIIFLCLGRFAALYKHLTGREVTWCWNPWPRAPSNINEQQEPPTVVGLPYDLELQQQQQQGETVQLTTAAAAPTRAKVPPRGMRKQRTHEGIFMV